MRIRKYDGKCSWCPNPAIKSLCPSCLEKNKLRQRARHEARKEKKLCQYCGLLPSVQPSNQCKKCKEYYQTKFLALMKTMKSMGLCWCKRPLKSENKCELHLAWNRVYVFNRRIRNLLVGLCYCGAPSAPNRTRCQSCLKRNRILDRISKLRKKKEIGK